VGGVNYGLIAQIYWPPVTGKSGDGGIEGLGVYRLGLVGFPVFFQYKRYQGSVGAGAVRDFGGAMTGRGDKGLEPT
jgi:restriction system protein